MVVFGVGYAVWEVVFRRWGGLWFLVWANFRVGLLRCVSGLFGILVSVCWFGGCGVVDFLAISF